MTKTQPSTTVTDLMERTLVFCQTMIVNALLKLEPRGWAQWLLVAGVWIAWVLFCLGIAGGIGYLTWLGITSLMA